MNENILRIQQRLAQLGFDPGPLDGVRGRRTIVAVKQFQTSRGLEADGMVGRETLRALFENHLPSVTETTHGDYTPWMDEIERVMGLHEVHHKKRLWDWLRSDGGTVGDPSQVPWCGDAVQTAIALSMPDEPIPTNPYLAANWMKFGKSVEPQFGSVLVFWRGSPSSWKGHVGFYVGETDTHYLVRGGNQQNKVCDSFIAKNRLREGGSRWPSTALPAAGRRIRVSGNGAPVTTNEE